METLNLKVKGKLLVFLTHLFLGAVLSLVELREAKENVET